MFSEIAEIALVAARLGQFLQFLKTRVILIRNFTRPHAITHTNCDLVYVRFAATFGTAEFNVSTATCNRPGCMFFHAPAAGLTHLHVFPRLGPVYDFPHLAPVYVFPRLAPVTFFPRFVPVLCFTALDRVTFGFQVITSSSDWFVNLLRSLLLVGFDNSGFTTVIRNRSNLLTCR